MMYLLKSIYKFYHDQINYYNDPRTKDYFLSNNILVLSTLAMVYYKFVTNWGPKYMENRPPFKLKSIIIAYNLLQVILSVRTFYMAVYIYVWGSYKIKCQPIDYSNSPLGLLTASEVHNYFLIKVLDLMDTVFFVLRKKQNQVTFLHLYHHLMMILASWIAARFAPGGHLVFVGLLNSFVHAFMYSYYLYALFKKSSQIWWKKYITFLQIFQFSLLAIHWGTMMVIPSCGFPKVLGVLFVPQNLFVMSLFIKFYYETYIKKKQIC